MRRGRPSLVRDGTHLSDGCQPWGCRFGFRGSARDNARVATFDPDEITLTPEHERPSAAKDVVYFDVAGTYTRALRCYAPASQGPTPERIAEALSHLASKDNRGLVESMLMRPGGLELNLYELGVLGL